MLNNIYNKYPHLFQFQIEELKESNEIKPSKKVNVEFEKLNSKRSNSYPFYKPMSKIIPDDFTKK